jgi:hypothetical protein
MKNNCVLSRSHLPRLPARAAEEATPEAIAKRQLDAFRNLDWTLAAFYTHPKALAQLKALFLPVALAGATAKDNPTAAEMMRVVFAGKDTEELARLEPEAFFRLVRGISGATPDFKRHVRDGVESWGTWTKANSPRMSSIVSLSSSGWHRLEVPDDWRTTEPESVAHRRFQNVVRAITARLQTP